MKKYFHVFLLSFKMQITWRFDVAMTVAAALGRILAAWIVWSAIFASRETVSGFSLQAMLTYYIVSSLLASLDMSHQISGELSHVIRAGQFSRHMVTPMNPQGFFGAMTAGESAFHLLFTLPAMILCAWLFGADLALTGNPLQAIYATVMILMGLVCMVSFNFFLGVLTFKFQNIEGFLHVKGNLIAFATGTLVPLALLPDGVVNVLRFLPFYYVTYQPSMILIGKAEPDAGMGMLVLACWTLTFLFISNLGYHRLRVRYDGVGI